MSDIAKTIRDRLASDGLIKANGLDYLLGNAELLELLGAIRPGDRLPNGLAVVSERLTEAMQQAAEREIYRYDDDETDALTWDNAMQNAHAAMLKAAGSQG